MNLLKRIGILLIAFMVCCTALADETMDYMIGAIMDELQWGKYPHDMMAIYVTDEGALDGKAVCTLAQWQEAAQEAVRRYKEGKQLIPLSAELEGYIDGSFFHSREYMIRIAKLGLEPVSVQEPELSAYTQQDKEYLVASIVQEIAFGKYPHDMMELYVTDEASPAGRALYTLSQWQEAAQEAVNQAKDWNPIDSVLEGYIDGSFFASENYLSRLAQIGLQPAAEGKTVVSDSAEMTGVESGKSIALPVLSVLLIVVLAAPAIIIRRKRKPKSMRRGYHRSR